MNDSNLNFDKIDENFSENNSDIINFEYPSPYSCHREKFNLNKKDATFAFLALAVSVFASLFGFFGGSLGYTVSVLLLFLIFAFYFADKKRLNFFSAACAVLALINSFVFVTTSNSTVRFWSSVLIFLLGIACFSNISDEKIVGNRATLNTFYSAFSSLGNMGVAIKSLFCIGNKKSIGKSLVGILCAVPLLIIIIPLLIRSDDAFGGMLGRLFVGHSGNIFRIIFGVMISPIFISYGFSLKYQRLSNVKKSNFKGIENIYITSFLSAISLCYALYLFSQLAYFFSAFKGFLPNGEITYSQYARKGFFEMLVIAVINLTVVCLSILIAKKQDAKVSAGIKAATTFISGFTILIILTAISKMLLYIEIYGMTVLRLTTSTFMVFFAVVFVATVIKIYTNKVNIVKIALLTASVFVLLLGILNVNSICAKYNYESYKSHKLKSIDVEAMYNLGDEGVPYVVKLACGEDKEISYIAQTYLAKAYKYDYFDNTDIEKFTLNDLKQNQKYNGDFDFSYPKSKAYDELYKFINANPKFYDFCYNYFFTEVETGVCW